jgi:hypothetical protein
LENRVRAFIQPAQVARFVYPRVRRVITKSHYEEDRYNEEFFSLRVRRAYRWNRRQTNATRKIETKQEINVVKQAQTQTEETQDEGIPLKRICAKLKIEPKTARRKLRAYWRKQDSDLSHTIRNRWSGSEDYAAQIEKILAAK